MSEAYDDGSVLDAAGTRNKLTQLLPTMLTTAGDDALEAICTALDIDPVFVGDDAD